MGGARMSNQPSILVVDDEMGILDVLRILLKGEGFDVTTAQGGKAGLEALKGDPPDIVLTDIKMPGVSGTEILAAVRDQDPETPVILMTAQASLQSAIQAVNQGAFYYIQKPFSNDDLVAICRRAAEQRLLKAENKQLKQEIRRRERSGLVKPLGKSRAFLDVMKLAEQVAPTESTVLIQGESGTGKEVIARYIHELSARAEGGFFSLNCGALPESLLESELFGHMKGSFTGAVRDKQGLFAAARGGTFFLDEIGEMSPATQVKLLRVLQEREAIPVGGTEAIPVDVRVVAATNRDLEEDIKRGRFRTDLYYRLNVIAIHLPPLRERRDDIQILWEEFLSRIAKEREEQPKALAQDAKDALLAYDWPGNVRELENALERAVVLSKATTIDLAALPDKLTERRAEPLVAERPHANPTLDVIERAYITWVLQSEGGNKTRAAEVLGIDPSTLYRKLSRYEGGGAGAAAALVPVWASPVLVTTDGPSHVYNALVADAVLSERAPYARYLEFDRDWTRPDRTAQFLLMGLGRVVGFETAERVVFTLAVVATLAGFLALLVRSHSGQGGAPLVALAPAAGWLAQTWFVWMGFYDFALSLALYAALLLVLRSEERRVG